jgi:hypothetical protein
VQYAVSGAVGAFGFVMTSSRTTSSLVQLVIIRTIINDTAAAIFITPPRNGKGN